MTFGRTWPSSALRPHKDAEGVKQLLAIVADEGNTRLLLDARASLMVLALQLEAMQTTIGLLEKRIVSPHRSNQ